LRAALGNEWGAAIFSQAGRLDVFFSSFIRWRELSRENEELKNKLEEGIALKASVRQLENENRQLKIALGIANRSNTDVIPGGIFDISLSPDGYTALLNKGSNDNVADGDIVITENNILLGMVRTVFASSAKVTLVSDPSFKVTVTVLGGIAKGIAKGMLDRGMAMELVVQTDDVKKGDTLVSSGDDMFPGGLVVGTVDKVEVNNAKLFKQVSVAPSASNLTGDVYILKQ